MEGLPGLSLPHFIKLDCGSNHFAARKDPLIPLRNDGVHHNLQKEQGLGDIRHTDIAGNMEVQGRDRVLNATLIWVIYGFTISALL